MKPSLIQSVEQTHREVHARKSDGEPSHAVVAERTYDTTIDDLWEAVTSPERIPRWFLPVEGDLRIGGRYQLHGNAGGTITACDPPAHLALTWEFDGQLSWLDVTLTTNSVSQTTLRIEHTVPDDAHWQQFGPAATGIGWDLTLFALDAHLTSGENSSIDDDMLASPDAIDAMRHSGNAWREADIASGTIVDVARGAAARAIAAYTGEQPNESNPGT